MSGLKPRHISRRRVRRIQTKPKDAQTEPHTKVSIEPNDAGIDYDIIGVPPHEPRPEAPEQPRAQTIGSKQDDSKKENAATNHQPEELEKRFLLSEHIRNKAFAILKKGNEQTEIASFPTSLLISIITLATVLFAILVSFIACISDNQQLKIKSQTINDYTNMQEDKMTESKDTQAASLTPETSSSSFEQVNAPHDDPNIVRILTMMSESLQTLGKVTPPVVATQLPPYPVGMVPTFDGSNVTAFLESFEDMAQYYQLSDKMKIDRLTAHCKPKQRIIIQSSTDYASALKDECWKDLRESLRRLFKSNDKDQQEARAEYFDHWLLQCQARTNLNIREYLQEFHIRSKRCIEATTIEEDRRGFYLVKGLPLRQATKVLERFSLRTDTPKSFNYKKIRDYLTTRLEVEEEARMLNPSEAVKELVPEVDFTVSPKNDQTEYPAVPQYHKAPPGFQPPKLQMQLRDDSPKALPTQSPPGKAPTRNEVDELVDKMFDLKINRASLELEPWKSQWTHRQVELMNNDVIRAEVDRRASDKASLLNTLTTQDARAYTGGNQYNPQPQQTNYPRAN